MKSNHKWNLVIIIDLQMSAHLRLLSFRMGVQELSPAVQSFVWDS